MDEDLRRQIEELKQYLASVDPEYRKEWLKALYGGNVSPTGRWQNSPGQQIITPHRSASQIAELEKQRAFAEAQVRKMEADQRKQQYEQWVQEMKAKPMQEPPRFRPTPAMMARQIHQARCEIIAMTIMGDLYAK